MNYKYRIKFSKTGPIKYIGHLDVMRYFQKAIRRSNLPIAYSAGFSPHQIMSFAYPLSVGYTSEGEYFDIEMTEQVNKDDIMDALNSQMSDGFSILGVRELPEKSLNCMSAVYAASYKVTLKESVVLPEDYKEKFVDFMSQMTIPVNKPKKKGGGFIEIDLKKFIYSYDIKDRSLYFTVNASSSDNIKASFVTDVFLEYLNLDVVPYMYNIHRLDILGNQGTDEDIKLISLLDF